MGGISLMKHIAMTAAAALASAATLLAAPAAMAAPAHDGGSAFRPAVQAPHRSVPVKAPTGASPATSYNGACGSGYGVVDSATLSTLGTVYLTYNSSNGYNCVATVRADPGTAMFMVAGIRLSTSNTWIVDQGQYTTYAGPVYVHAPGQCIDWGGQIGSVYVQNFDTHCG